MKSFYYDIDNAAFTDQSGEKLARCVPELFYQERAEWRIFLRDGENLVPDLSGVVAWGAAVAADFNAATPPMCRADLGDITVDTATGMATISLDAATEEFLAAVDGAAVRPAWFELCGLDAAGRRAVNVFFEIRVRMTLAPDPEADTHTPDTVATKAFAYALIDSALASAAVVASGAAVQATSGAIFSNTEIDTTVGDYHITYTSGGGLSVSGSGASVVLSGGQIAASGGNGESLTITSGGVYIDVIDENEEHQALRVNGDGVSISGMGPGAGVNIHGGASGINFDTDSDNGITVNSRPVATQLVTSTSVGAATVYIPVLSGGTSYFADITQELIVDSVVKTTEASYIHFTLDSVTAPTPVVISGVSYLNSATFEGGKEYLVGFFDGMAVVNEVTSGGVLQ